MSEHRESAEARRKKLQDEAASIGVTEAYISQLVDAFYTKIRAHDVLGPIFAGVIKDGDWTPHLTTMKKFWSSVALSSGLYSGQPVPKHKAVSAIRPEHFTLWLDLFEQTLHETAPHPAAIPHFMERASRIGKSLQLALFWTPELAAPDLNPKK